MRKGRIQKLGLGYKCWKMDHGRMQKVSIQCNVTKLRPLAVV